MNATRTEDIAHRIKQEFEDPPGEPENCGDLLNVEIAVDSTTFCSKYFNNPMLEDDQSDRSGSDSPVSTSSFDLEDSESTSLGTAHRQEDSTASEWQKDIRWKEGSFNNSIPSVQWMGITRNNVIAKSPIEYFKYFYDNAFFEFIVEQSNLYATQINPNKPLNLNVSELEIFLGTVMYMSCASLPHTRLHWSKIYRNSNVAEVMSRDRWETIKRNLHFNDNDKQFPKDDPNFDKLFKIRPCVEHLRMKFIQRPPDSENLCLGEQTIPSKSSSCGCQYTIAKPSRKGYKMFVLTDDMGIVHNFELYNGKSTMPNFDDIGISGNIALKLVSILPVMQNYKLHFSEWFSSIPLLCALKKVGIQCLCTARANRLPNINFPSDGQKRGFFSHRTSDIDGVSINAIRYFDKQPVTFLTTYAPVDTVDEEQEIIKLFNSRMTGVNRIDHMISLYRCNVKSKKWYHRVFFHLMDMICVSIWHEYKRDCLFRGANRKEIKDLLDFKSEIAEYLCKGGKSIERKRDWSSTNIEDDFEAKKRKGPTKAIPNSSVRLDEVGHWPEYKEKRGRCKLPGCKSITKVFCTKCLTYLCFSTNSNCFLKFHTEL